MSAKKMRLVTFLFVVSILFEYGTTLPCLTTGSKKDFTKARNALKSLASTLQSQITSINSKVKILEKDMIAIEEDFKERKWRKYNNHCYYFGTEAVKWTTAERQCREIGGYLVKIDDSSEQSWVFKEAMKTKSYIYWLGITDVVNGDWRWIYDQTKPSYKFWYPGRPYSSSTSNSKINNCAYMNNSNNGKWVDYPCYGSLLHICESNFCFS